VREGAVAENSEVALISGRDDFELRDLKAGHGAQNLVVGNREQVTHGSTCLLMCVQVTGLRM
jgi:hypothetical protein